MVKKFLSFSLGSVLSAAISLFTTPVITALIIPQEMGKASMFTLALNLFLQVFILGMDQGYVRTFYTADGLNNKNQLFSNSMLLPLIAWFFGAIVIYFFSNSISTQLIGEQSNVLILLLIITLGLSVLERFLMLKIRMEQRAITFSILRFLAAVTTFLVTYYYARYIRADFYAIIWATMITLLITCMVIIIMDFKVFFQWEGVNKKQVKDLLIYGLPFVPTFLASWVFEGIDKMMLRRFSSFEELGLFSASFKFVSILSILQLSFSTFWVPVSMEMYEKNSKEAAAKFSEVFSTVCSVLFLGSVLLIAGKDVIMVLFDKSYDKSGEIMPFLLLIPVMYSLSEITVGGINYAKKTYWHLAISVSVALINLTLNYFFVPVLGAKGAAISTGITYIVFFFGRTIVSNKYFHIKVDTVKLILALIVFSFSALATTFPYYINRHIVNLTALLLMLVLFRNEIMKFYLRYGTSVIKINQLK